jgi:general secretion pathway protein F
MPLFSYKAVSRAGESMEGERESVDEGTLVAALQTEGFIPIWVKPAGARFFPWGGSSSSRLRLGHKEIMLFTRELLTLLQAGLPLDRAMNVLLDLTAQDPKLHTLIDRVLKSVKGGTQLSEALDAQGGVFSRFYINLVRAGEAGGALEQVLERLTEYLERSKELRDTVVTAMIYPAILLVMATGSLMVLLMFVVPQFMELFESAGKELPVPTQIVIAVADGLQNYWWLIALVIGAIVLFFRAQLADPRHRPAWDRRLLWAPLIGELVRKLETSSFARTLGTLLQNGVPLLTAMSIVKETLNNRAAAERVEAAVAVVKEGGGLSAPLAEVGWLPDLAVQMIKLGEESGHLPEMLERIANTYDKEVKITVQRLLALLEPVLIVGLGIVIAGIIASIMMAILSVNDLAF